MPTNYPDLIPVTISREVLQAVQVQSAVMALARTIQMPTGMAKIPVVSVAPQADFVTPAYGGRKPIGTVEWTSQAVTPEEIAVTLSIPNAFLDDAGFPVWENVRPLVATAIARRFDDAVINGTGAPASYPAGGLVAAAQSEQIAAAADPLTALDDAFAAIEDNGLEVDGVLGGPSLLGLLRGAAVSPAELAAGAPRTIYGVPMSTTPVWAPGAVAPFKLALVGDWEYVVVGVREDVTFDLSEDGVLSDAAGVVVVNAFQQDSTLMRCYMRVGVAVGQPVGPDGTTVQKPLALAQTTVLTARAGGREAGTTTTGKTTRKSS